MKGNESDSFQWCFFHFSAFFHGVKTMWSFCGLKHLDRDKQMVPGASANGQRKEAPGIRSRSGEHWIGGLVFLQKERRAQALAALRCRLINARHIWSTSRCAKSSNEMCRHVSRVLTARLFAATRQRTSVHRFLFSLCELSPLDMAFSGREKGMGRVGGVDVRGVKE